ncbi:hypothetical protein LCGC14_0365390 [marine sediment metagenome]|uniref:Uncharacterized protein n=1 Tax=marine sediment metagenome TaxID=412755 RepID=A0A0F9WF38_9ZZZZ
MTKQEEIREDTARTFYEGSEISRMLSWVDLPQEVRDIFFDRADSYLFRIHSQGVVIKGKNHPRHTDYFQVEPLIDIGKIPYPEPTFRSKE